MMKATVLALTALTLVACGGSTPAVADPSQTTTTTATPETPATPAAATPATPATPAAATPAPEATPAPAAPAPEKTENCATAKEASGKDLKSCKATCAKLDDKVPAGSKCIPPKTGCLSNCDTKFKK